MRILSKAMVYSLILHVIYFISMGLYGLIKTTMFQPDIMEKWNDTNTLQQEVTFGFVFSPVYYIASFLGVTLLLGILLWFIEKM